MMRESLRRLAVESPMERRRVGTRRIAVELLDGHLLNLDIDRRAKGAVLLDLVCEHLDIVERDFFGLLHAVRGDPRVWLNLNTRLAKTFKNEPWEVRFAVKFYPPEPSEVADEVTRDHLLLAVKRELLEDVYLSESLWNICCCCRNGNYLSLSPSRDEMGFPFTHANTFRTLGRLTCSFITHALLASYILQAELGDLEDKFDSVALSELRVAPSSVLGPELEEKIEELYKMHKGQTPAEAVINYLDNAKKLALYGGELHCVRDSQEVDLVLCVNAHGVQLYRDGILENRLPWAKVLKISFNKRIFTLRLRAGEFDDFETVVSFRMASAKPCKRLWRSCVEHHMFFRRESPVPVKRVPGLGFGTRSLSCRRTFRQMKEISCNSGRSVEVAA